VLLVRIRTLAAKQWTVGRAFNRLLKIAFNKHRIAFSNPTQIALISEPASIGRAVRHDGSGPHWRRA
jgi:small-conductance mechanosensitive channel